MSNWTYTTIGFVVMVSAVALTLEAPSETKLPVQPPDYAAHAKAQERCTDTASKVVLHLISTGQTNRVPSIDEVLEEVCK